MNDRTSPDRTPAGRHIRQSGFTLIEIVLALLIFALGCLALVSLFPSGLKMSREAQEFTRMAQFAETAFNALELELQLRPELAFARGWGPSSGANACKVYDPQNGYAGSYNWAGHKLTITRPSNNLWHDPDKLIMVVSGMESGPMYTNAYLSAWDSTKQTMEYGVRYKIRMTQGDKKLVEMLVQPNGQHLFNPDPDCGWPSANPITPGLTYSQGGLPPYENDFFSVPMDPPQGYRNIGSVLMVTVEILPGVYGPSHERLRFFHRWYGRYAAPTPETKGPGEA
jgi:prepilin-type N-terminal cleavage/methylation domain-containing protein